MENLRMKNRKDMIPAKIEGQSFMDWVKSNNGGHLMVYGSIGYDGKKTHRFFAYYININGENVIVSLASHCGSQAYKSGLSANLQMTKEQVTCKKCCK
jgi:hypothetical protein